MKKRNRPQFQKAIRRFAYYSSIITLTCTFFIGCDTPEQGLAGTWILPGHSHYFDLRADGGYLITGVDGYRETGEWVTTNGSVLLRNRLGTDTLWYRVNGKYAQLEERKKGIALSMERVKENFDPVQESAILEYLLGDTLAFYDPGGSIKSSPIYFHEDALLDLVSREEKLWRLKQFKNEWFLGIEAFSVMEYSRITAFEKNGIELEYLDRRSYSLRRTYLRKYQ